MTTLLRLATLAAIFLGATSPAFADIVFIDLNGSEREIIAAREAASARGERLIVVPELTSKERAVLSQFQSKSKALETRIKKLEEQQNSPAGGTADSTNRLILAKAELELLTQKRNETFSSRAFSIEKLESTIAALDEAKRPVTAMVISGHSNGYTLWGDLSLNNGTVRPSDIGELAKRYPGAMSSLRSLMLWGCYTGTAGSTFTWKSTLSQLKIIAGFYDSGPSGTTRASADLLKDFLMKDASIAQKRMLGEINQAIRNLNYARITATAALVHDCYFNVKSGAKPLSEIKNECDLEKDHYLATLLTEFSLYLQAKENAFANPPTDTHHSSLRDFYSAIQRYSHCEEIAALVPRERILALIFFENVRKNFAEYYAEYLKEFREKLEPIIGPEALEMVALPDLKSKTTTRQAIVTSIMQLQNLIANLSDRLQDDMTDEERTNLQALVNTLEEYENIAMKTIGNLDCVPMTWITSTPVPGVKPETPSCRSASDSGNS